MKFGKELIIICVMIKIICTAPPKVDSFEEKSFFIQGLSENPGIYFERLNNVRFTRTSWKITIFVDINKYAFDHEHFATVLTKIKSSCNTTAYPGQCRNTLRTLNVAQSTIGETKEQFDDLVSELSDIEPAEIKTEASSRNIKKRGAPLAIVGSVSHALFGTLSEEEGEYYKTKIDALEKTQEKALHLAKEELHIVQHKFADMQRRLVAMKYFATMRATFINETWKAISELETGAQVLQYWSSVLASVHDIERICFKYQQTYDRLKQMVHMAKLGHLHPNLLDKRQLQKIITQIEANKGQYVFPIKLQHASGEKLTKLATTKLGYKENRLLIEVSIPLLDKMHAEAYKIHPLPITQKIEGHQVWSSFVQSKAEVIIMTHDQRKYTFFSMSDLKNCKMHQMTHVCNYQRPLMQGGENASCEYLLLNKANKNNLRKCQLTTLKKQVAVWIRLESLDGWLFSVPEESIATIKCPGERYRNAHLKGIGILQIRSQCTAVYEETELISSQSLGDITEDLYLPQIHLNIMELDKDIIRKGKLINDKIALNKKQDILFEDMSLDQIDRQYTALLTYLTEQANHKSLTMSGLGLGSFTLILLLTITGGVGVHKIIEYVKRKGAKPIKEEGPEESSEMLRPNPQKRELKFSKHSDNNICYKLFKLSKGWNGLVTSECFWCWVSFK